MRFLHGMSVKFFRPGENTGGKGRATYSPHQLGTVQYAALKIYVDSQDEEFADVLHDVASTHIDFPRSRDVLRY